MLTLIDTVIGFAVIMVLLSFLIKSLTSVVKNHIQYYCDNLRKELELLLKPLGTVTLKEVESRLGGIDWRNVGEELLDRKNLEPILKKIDSTLDLTDLEARLEVHKSALKFAFDRRLKNLTLACGVALCLLVNINAFSIWTTIYADADVRAKFSSEEYVEEVLQRAEGEASAVPAAPPAVPPANPPASSVRTEDDKKALEKERLEWREELERFRDEVDFGVGAIWSAEDPSPRFVLYQIIGSLLTGFLASIGAPYLHDLLRTITSFRKS